MGLGMIECKVHGLSPIDHVCHHIGQAIDEGSELPAFAKYPIETTVPKLEVWLDLYFCHECIARRGLPVPARNISESEQKGEYHDMLGNLGVACLRCFEGRVSPSGSGRSKV